jgi:putative flippase GtrA
MARPYISIGRGGPRFGVVLGRRDISDISKLAFVGVGAVAILFGLLNMPSSIPPQIGAPLIIATPVALIFAAFWWAWGAPKRRRRAAEKARRG